jgi:hypothetical protein
MYPVNNPCLGLNGESPVARHHPSAIYDADILVTQEPDLPRC